MTSPLAIPVKLDAFVLNPDTCDGVDRDQAKIAPLQQPNYSYLRMKDFMTRNDVLPAADLHAASPHQANSRVTNLATGDLRQSRLGVYLHWMIPRPYRSGAMPSKENEAPHAVNSQMPVFPECPNRWLVIRKLAGTTEPPNVLPDVKAWIVYSDWMRNIDELDDTDERPMDLQVDVSPYLSTGSTVEDEAPSIDRQAEVFIGGRTNASKKDMITPEKRVSLGVLNSSNQLFPDYQPHNGNVFSMLDNFEYRTASGTTASVTHGVADYYVLGWHDDATHDLLNLSSGTRGDRLQSLAMHLQNASDPSIENWLKDSTGAKSLCHGAMYGVRWNANWGKDDKPTILADQAAKAVAERIPVSVGTTPLDSLLAYVTTHSEGVEHQLKQLGALLRAQSESIEDRRAAEDEVQNYNFERTAGGSRYVFQPNPKDPSKPPSADALEALQELNENQALSDASARQLKQVKWNIFSIWWRYVTDLSRDETHSQENYKEEAEKAKAEHVRLARLYSSQQDAVQASKNKIAGLDLQLKEATSQTFDQQRDPTLFVGDVKAGWPLDYLNALQVRLDPQIPRYSQGPAPSQYGLECLPSDLRDLATKLVHEFDHYKDPAGHIGAMETETVPPLYHDGRDQWNNTQPWFPLFLEWEAEYFHVPYDEWGLQQSTTHAAQEKKLGYKIKQDNGPLWEKTHDDHRKITGRILLLPQPVFSLHGQVERLFATVSNDELDKIIPSDKRTQLLKDIQSLPFISAPLSGFTEHLTTRVAGSHVKPTVRYPGREPEPLEEAYADSQKVYLDAEALRMMGMETDLTPYGSLEQLGNLEHPACKPVTHGQIRLTKLNIIDKFGQAVAVVDPTRRVEGPPPLNPHISEFYRPQPYDGFPNVIKKPQKPDECPFMQLPPSINQPSRLHMNWVQPETYEDKKHEWKPSTEWDNPIWGWVVVNYVDYGLQFFLKDGTFYREVRVASPHNPNPGAVASDKWLPFEPPDNKEAEQQLDQLIKQFTERQEYLLGFMDMISNATQQGRTAPGAYSQCINSLVGRPLALANAGFSLELGEDARQNQSTVGNQPDLESPITLLPTPNNGSKPQYDFAVKLGDSSRLHDGLVGYFPAKESPVPNDELVLDHIFSHFPQDNTGVDPIDESSFLRLKPYWLNPTGYSQDTRENNKAGQYVRDRNLRLQVFGLLVDPFTPVNAYSSVLPIQPLVLPPWTWETALQKMTAFFHFGPLVVEDDVPEYSKEKKLKPDYDLKKEKQAGEIKLPALGTAEWNWLQPYIIKDTEVTETPEAEAKEAFMALSLGKINPVPQFAAGPLTAVEGYLQMKQAIAAKQPE